MKGVMKKGKPEEVDVQYFSSSPRKDLSFGLIRFVTLTVIFMAGAVLGLSVSSTFTRFYPSHTDVFFPKTVYTSNCDRGCLEMNNFINPPLLWHRMTDEQLFWRGSMAPTVAEYPYKRLPKVAFMFLTRGPMPLVELWDRFFHGHEKYFSVYVHAAPGYNLNVSRNSAFYGRQIPSRTVEWGSINLVDAEKRLLANALLDFSNERFILLSESCMPVYNFPKVYNYLLNSAHSFVESYDEDSPRGRGRYSKYMYPLVRLYHWRKGSEWFEMNRKLAITMISDHRYYAVFKRHCKPSCYPDEHYIPTYINMFHGNMNSNRTVTWVDWSKEGPHPAMFGRSDVNETFIQSIRNNGTMCTYNNRATSVCYLFARKFAPSALEPLLNMSSRVMRY